MGFISPLWLYVIFSFFNKKYTKFIYIFFYNILGTVGYGDITAQTNLEILIFSIINNFIICLHYPLLEIYFQICSSNKIC